MGKRKKRSSKAPNRHITNPTSVPEKTILLTSPIKSSSKNIPDITARATSVAWFSGPLPHPGILAQYNDIVPGLADRIVKMAENQSDHRIGMERKVIGANIVKEYLGWASATLIALVVICLGAFLVYRERSAEGFATIAGTGIYYAIMFYVGKKRQGKELSQKRERLGAPNR